MRFTTAPRLIVVCGLIICGLAVVAAFLIFSNLRREPTIEPDRGRGPLTEALFAASADPANGTILDAVYGRFIPSDMPLEDRAALLRENGFGCKMEPYKTKLTDAMTLRCIRTIQGAWGCKGFEYYAFRTTLQDGSFYYLPEGNTFEISGDRRMNDRCPVILERQNNYDRSTS